MAKEIKTIDIRKIQVGEIDNATLVEWLGSQADKKIDNNLKTTLLKREACECEIQDLGKGKHNTKKRRF